MAPADERLEANRSPGGQRHHRLVTELDLAPLQCQVEIALELERRIPRLPQLRIEQLAVRSAEHASAVQRRLRITQSVLGVLVPRGTHGDADRRRQAYLPAPEAKRPGHLGEDAVADQPGVVQIDDA